MPKTTLDAIDRQIIAELQANGRLTNVQLADRVNLSPSPCLRRIKRLEANGVLKGYRAILDREMIGLGFTVFLGIKIDGHGNRSAVPFQDAILAMPEVVACHLISGDVDYLIEVIVPDLEYYRQFLVDKLLEVEIVKEVRTSVSIETLKSGEPLPLNHLSNG